MDENEVGPEEVEQAILGAMDEDETEPSSEPEEVESVEEPEDDDAKVPVKAVQEERRKRQELERELAEVKRGVQSLQQQQPMPQPKDIYEAYDRDAVGVTTQLNSQIKKLVDEDPYGNAANIEQLRDLKDELRRRETVNIQRQLNTQSVASTAYNQLVSVIPDFQKLAPDLTKFAVEELGYDQNDLARCALVNGPAAVKEIVRVNNLYQKLHAKPLQKETRPRPTQVETPGQTTKKVEQDLGSLMKEAQRTGNWEKYFDAKGLL